MQYAKGKRVKHSSRPEWGIGEIVDTTIDGKVKVYFQIGGFRTLSIGGAKLEIVNAAEVIAPLEISLKLTVSVDEAKRSVKLNSSLHLHGCCVATMARCR